MPDQHDWGLSGGRVVLPHSHVYRRDVSLQAGTTYHFLTRNLQRLTSANPDPVMYLVRGNDIVALNDDYTGLASEIIYTPTATDTYRVVIRAYTTATPGFCDVYQGAAGAAPSLLDSNVMFGGTYVRVRWKQGEWFETGVGALYFSSGVGGPSGPAADPYLFLIYPASLVAGARCIGTMTAPDFRIQNRSPVWRLRSCDLGCLLSLHRWRVPTGPGWAELQGSMDVACSVGVRCRRSPVHRRFRSTWRSWSGKSRLWTR